MRKPMIFAIVIAAIGVGSGEASAKTKKTKDHTFTSKINKATPKLMKSETPLNTPSPPAGPLPIPYPNVAGQSSGPGRAGDIRRNTVAPKPGGVSATVR